ncbi:MAG: bifunctional riboflavin kinase/FAD synthetase [Verrucomicrobia bacterium]|nr:bifunctional riboflavin kinase/FAD synthetase [Verrucomicrobiota bacterium]
MQILQKIADLAEVAGPVHLAIGVFDGIHLGHQAVIAAARESAGRSGGSAVVLTFHPHPVRVLKPEAAPRLLTSTQHKAQLIRALGVHALLVQEFTIAFSQTRPEEFVRLLYGAANPLRQICVGKGWTFGANRSGNIATLDALAQKYGFALTEVPAVTVDGQPISSTIIRAAVQRGELERAARLLGRPFTVLGTVSEGNRLGRQLGFPTANLHTHNEQFPPDGVYAVRAWHAEKEYGGVVNIGIRPTLGQQQGERLLELYLFDFDRQIYGEDVEVEFLEFLRPEQKFDGLPELVEQIKKDVLEAQAIYQGRPRPPGVVRLES